jgi:hypothetical protein
MSLTPPLMNGLVTGLSERNTSQKVAASRLLKTSFRDKYKNEMFPNYKLLRIGKKKRERVSD